MKKDRNRIVLRADGNSDIGLGHIMRLLGLFEFIKEDFNCIFCVRQPEIKIKEIIESYCEVIALESATLIEEMSELESLLCENDIVVLDGYDFNEKYQQYIKSKVYKLAMVDDKADMHFYADLIINHGDVFANKKYSREPYTKILGGIDYLIIRKEFLKAASLEKRITKIDSLFICMGGADPFNITVKALNAAIKCDFVQKIIVITGNAFTKQTDLEGIVFEGSKSKEIIYERNVNALRLIELISMSELAICPASSVALEVCCVKAGLLTGTVVDNQINLHQQLLDFKCGITLNDFNKVTVEDIITKMSLLNDTKLVNSIIQNQQKAIDGRSDERLRLEFKSLCSC